MLPSILNVICFFVGPVKKFNHTSWVAVVTPTDRPKSVGNPCVIELFVALFVLSLCLFDISFGVWGVCHRTESDLFLFLFIPTESGEKVGSAVAIFLTFAVLMSTINNSVPKLSNHQFRLRIYMTIEMIVSGVTIIMEVFVIGLYHCLRVKRIGWSFRILLLKPFSYVKDCRNPKECKDTFCECAFSSDIEVEHFNDWHVYALRIDKFFF